jgi:ectoine hydroxylase
VTLRCDYDRDGFVYRPALLRPAEVEVILTEVDRLVAGAAPPAHVLFERDATTVRTLSNPHTFSDVFDRLVHHPTLLAAAMELLDDDVYVFQLGVNCKAAFTGDAWFWHQDYPGYQEDDHIPMPRMVNTLIFLDEFTTLNGPLMLVPGSHRLVTAMPEESDGGTAYTFRYADPETIRAEVTRGGVVAPTGPGGSVIFMNVNTLHGSTANMSPWSRRMITLTYNAMSNKATSPSVRARHIVADDRDATALQPLGPDCLLEAPARLVHR